MALPDLLAIGPNGYNLWAAAHQVSHNKVSKFTKTPFIIVDPIRIENYQSQRVFLLRHALAHQEANLFFNTAGPDLSELDFNNPQELQDWVDLNFTDHQNWEAKIGPG